MGRLGEVMNLLELITTKNRSGPTVSLELFADMPCNYFADLGGVARQSADISPWRAALWNTRQSGPASHSANLKRGCGCWSRRRSSQSGCGYQMAHLSCTAVNSVGYSITAATR